MIKLYQYFSYRFPLVALSVFALLLIAAIHKQLDIAINLQSLFLYSLLYVGFLLHLRLLDEFKDYNYDSKFHPDRPVQKGIVSLSNIKSLAIINVISMILLVTYLDSHLLVLFVIALLYSGLMYKEFWINNFWERSSVLYLISHEIIFLPLHYYFFSAITDSLYIFRNLAEISFFIYTILPIILIEIGRKMNHRYSPNKKKTTDTYAYSWGEQLSTIVFSLLVVFGFTLYMIFSDAQNSLIFSSLSVILLVVSLVAHPIVMRYHMAITVIVAYFFSLILLI